MLFPILSMDYTTIAAVLHAERPPKRERAGGGVSGALWAKWKSVVLAFADTLEAPAMREAFLRACEVEGKDER